MRKMYCSIDSEWRGLAHSAVQRTLAPCKGCTKDSNGQFNPAYKHNDYYADARQYALAWCNEVRTDEFVCCASANQYDGCTDKISRTPMYVSVELHANEWYCKHREYDGDKSHDASDSHLVCSTDGMSCRCMNITQHALIAHGVV